MPTSIATLIPNTIDCQQQDTTPPPQPVVQIAAFGSFTEAAATQPPRDPLVMQFANLEPGSRLEFINYSENPAASFDCKADIKTLVALDKHNVNTGRFVWGDKQAEAIGILPGDKLMLRQVDAAGNASPPVFINLQNRPSAGSPTYNVPAAQGSMWDGADDLKNDTRYTFTPRADTRAPVVLPKNMSLGLGSAAGYGLLQGKGAFEPHARVTLFNTRTQQETAAIVNSDGSFRLEFPAQIGDKLRLKVRDQIGDGYDRNDDNVVDMGEVVFAPVCSATELRTGQGGAQG